MSLSLAVPIISPLCDMCLTAHVGPTAVAKEFGIDGHILCEMKR